MAENDIKTISIAGAGKVAGHLAVALVRAGFRIDQIFSRHIESAKKLADLVGANSSVDPSTLDARSDLLIIAIPDQAIAGFAELLKKTGNFNGLVVHTSGSQPLSAISGYFEKAGVFYPLQSFTQFSKPDISRVPFCIEGATSEIASVLAGIAGHLSSDIRIIDSSQRAAIHLAAVFASNFTNHMYAIADRILGEADVKPDILYPLINETATRIIGRHPEILQTGPAIRNDWSTIEAHLGMLEKYPAWKEIYKSVSENIGSIREKG